MSVSLLSLGSNVGSRQETLDAAVVRLSQWPGVRVLARSRWRETAPIGGPPGQENFLNGALALETSLPPLELLAQLQQIETEFGRRRDQRWGARTLDLDVLLYGDVVLTLPTLTLPHPRMALRRFVLEPAAEVAGAMMHPTIRWSVAKLLDHLNHSRPYAAIAGPIAVGKTQLAEQLSRETPARLISERPDWRRLCDFYANPAACGLAMELAFLEDRTRLLATDNAAWREKSWAVSDFWFDQSRAFAKAWLLPEQFRDFSAKFESSRALVVRPRLTLLLDAPADELWTRVRRRGRACERPLTAESLERIRRAILEQMETPDVGPVLRLAGDAETIAAEAVAALRGME
jgi:2-amino-4-hydroxy-6-hydroxymethyldihydropteridine diphosphokinase